MIKSINSKDREKFYETLRRIPSVETQLMYWIEAHQNYDHIHLMLNHKFEYGGKEVYVRKITETIKRRPFTTLEIASIEINKDLRGRLWFTNFLTIAHKINPWDFTAIDCVTNQDLDKFLYESGWNLVKGVNRSFNSFYKKVGC